MPEKYYILKETELQVLVTYVLAVPTGTLPGQRLAAVLNTLNKLEELDPTLVPRRPPTDDG